MTDLQTVIAKLGLLVERAGNYKHRLGPVTYLSPDNVDMLLEALEFLNQYEGLQD